MHTRTEHLEGEAETDKFLPSQDGQDNLPDIAMESNRDASSPPAEGFAAAPPLTVAHVGGEYPEDSFLSEGKQSEKASERLAKGYPAAAMPPKAARQDAGVPFSATGAEYQVWLVPSGGRSGPFPTSCRNCNYSGPLSVRREAGAITWISSAFLCIMGAWICAPLIFCCPLTKDQVLRCPSCGLELCRRMP